MLICGATGTLGQAFARASARRAIPYLLTGRDRLDLERPGSIAAVLDAVCPWAVVNAAGWVRVDDAESAEAACHRVNASGAVALARACADRGIGCLAFSSDLVFDGAASRPYVESDPVGPLSTYGRSKAAMEASCAGLPGMLVARTAAFFSADDRYNFAVAVLEALAQGRSFAAAQDYIVTPTFVPGLVDAALDLLIDGTEGIWHLSGGEAVSWAEFATRIARACGHDPSRIKPVPGASLGWRAPRPLYTASDTEKGATAGALDAGIARFAHAYGVASAKSRAA